MDKSIQHIKKQLELEYTMTWLSYDHFKRWLGSARILNYSNILSPIFCSCIHTTGVMMIWEVPTASQLIGKRNTKGRRKKAKHALSKDDLF
jgi:hypothetical protein